MTEIQSIMKSDIHHRHSIRLREYDYSQEGLYFVTICVQNKVCVLGKIAEAEMRLNELGEIVEKTWRWLPQQYPYVSLGEWIIMPNHFHGILIITDNDDTKESRGDSRIAHDVMNDMYNEGGSRTAPTKKRKTLGRLIGAFKTETTKNFNQINGTPGNKLWQRNYYEHIIRDGNDHARIVDYIENNPMCWETDELNTCMNPKSDIKLFEEKKVILGF